MNDFSFRININPRLLVRWLFVATISLTVIHVVLQYLRWELGFQQYTPYFTRFDLDQEMSVPTWFSQFLFLFSAILLFVVRSLPRELEAKRTKYWTFLACLFVYFSIDDVAMIHEQFNDPVRALVENIPFANQLDTPWVLLALVLLIPLGLYLIRFLRSIDKRTCGQLMLAGTVFLLGAIGVELISTNFGGFEYKMIVALEETLENLGLVLFIRTLLLYIERQASNIGIVLLSK